MTVRPESADDATAIRAVHQGAFGSDEVADLVDRMRREAEGYLAFVAEDDGVVGHAAFTVARFDPPVPGIAIRALGPMGVAPDRQRQGIGRALVQHGLAACAEAGCDAVFVLGPPDYFKPLGFERAARLSILNEYGAPTRVFRYVELRPGALTRVSGMVRYDPVMAPQQ